jgi:hypothetical protein
MSILYGAIRHLGGSFVVPPNNFRWPRWIDADQEIAG